MSIEWMDDFSVYGTDANRVNRMFDGVWAVVNWCDLIADPDPNAAAGSRAFQVQGNAANQARRVLSGARTTIGIAARYWLTALPIDASVFPLIAAVMDQNAAMQIYLLVDPTGYLKCLRRDTAGDVQIGISAAPVITANSWKHIETKIIMDVANGRVTVKIEGITVLDSGVVRTTSDKAGVLATMSNIFFQCNRSGASPGMNFNVKDLIIWNGLGAFNNDFMGSCQVYKIIPDGDVSLNWLTSAGATGYNLINETTPDDDGSYIFAPYILSTPTNGALSATAGGALGATTYYVRSTWVNSTGETLGAAETSLAVAANNVLNVAAPGAAPQGATGWNVYVSTAAGTETKQNVAPIGIAAAWVEPNTGLIAGAALPGANTTAIPSAYKCSLTDLPVTVTSVRGVMPIHRSRKTDGGDGALQVGAISGANTGLGTNRQISTAYTYWWDVFDNDPSGAAWTKVGVNAMNLQLNRTS